MQNLQVKIAIKTVVLAVLVSILTLFILDIKKNGAVLPSVSFSQVINAFNPLDLDGDGMPNTWEDTYGLDPNDPSDAALDPDNDGLTNLNEYLNNTDPTNSDTDGGSLIDGLEVQQGKNPLDPTDDIDPVEEPVEEDPDEDEDNDDDDNDGDKDQEESDEKIEQPTPDNEDSDGDRLTNEEELTIYFTNPLMKDSDYDGLTDYEEIFAFSTDPNKFDTDGGGVGDGDEVANRTDPNNPFDDIKYTFYTYILNDKENTLKSRHPNKFICVANEPFTLVFETELENSNVKVLINGRDVEKLICPKSGVNVLAVSFDINNKPHLIRRRLETLPKGKVELQYTGWFSRYYKYIPFYKNTLLRNQSISLDILENNEFKPYVSDKYSVNGKIQTNINGEYFLGAIPGKYKYSYKKYEPGFFENTTKGPIIYNKKLVLEKNGDALFIALIVGFLTLTFGVAYSLISDIVRLIKSKTRKKR